MPDIQSIRDYLEEEFLPFEIPTDSTADLDIIDRSIRDAVEEWNHYAGSVEIIERPYGEVIDLSDVEGRVRNVIAVIPDENTMIQEGKNLFGGKRFILEGYAQDFRTMIDGENRLTNFVLKVDLWNQIKDFLGTDPEYKFYNKDQKLYLANYPSEATKVAIKVSLEIPYDMSYNIEDSESYRWIKRFSLASLKERQGRLWATTQNHDVDLDGSELRSEGKDEQKNLIEQIDGAEILI